MRRRLELPVIGILLVSLLAGCQAAAQGQSAAQSGGLPRVVAAENFLADFAANVAGSRLAIDTLIPTGVDPHGFEPTPADVRKVADSGVVIVNGAGFETFLARILDNAGGQHRIVEASAGLTSRTGREGENAAGTAAGDAKDPHFWLDPNFAVMYVQNIRDGLSQADPAGAATYAANADGYIAKLKELDAWIAAQVAVIPPAKRLLVTNHESFGYFADRYGFRVIGTVIPSVSTSASPSAQELARLADLIRATGVKAIFLETGANPQLAEQLAQETGVKVIADLYTHSLTDASGPAPDYITMMHYDTQMIVDALK